MRIGELARRTGCDVETVRYYEREGLLTAPERDVSGYRRYQPHHLAMLQFVRHGRSLSMKLSDIRQLLDFRRHPEGDCSGVNQILDTQIARVDEQIAALHTLKEQLIALRNECEQRQTTEQCGILRSLDQSISRRQCPCHRHESGG
ncbi:MAG: MerR family transcriptional regulator [Magnetococcales bacterium]|nr:MerR family transcriptional regulator [Magnetococcales bacterium]